MARLDRVFILAATWLACSIALAQAPAAAPAGSTGLCKDGSYTSNAAKKGACTGHKGVKDWYAADAKSATPTKAPPATTAATMPAQKPASPVAASMAAPATMAGPKPAATSTTAAAPGAAAGQVWFNSDSKVYHCSGSRYFGKTKQGEYMSVTAAKAAGGKPANGKDCS